MKKKDFKYGRKTIVALVIILFLCNFTLTTMLLKKTKGKTHYKKRVDASDLSTKKLGEHRAVSQLH